MAIIAIVVVVVAVGMIRSRARSAARDLAGVGANEFLKAPPTSFPVDPPAERPVPAAPAVEPAASPDEPTGGFDAAGT